jgi:hypothetical protein
MRLFEVAGNQFQDDLANVLKVMQGQADSKQTTSLVRWSDINNRLQGYGDIDQDIVNNIKDKIDKDGTLIQDVVPEGIVLKTKVASPEQADAMAVPTGGKSIDAMAKSAAQDSLK